MSKLSKIALLLSAFAVVGLGLYVGGCSKDSPTGSAKAATTELCVKCGQIKGSETCCKADAEKCDKCELAKGAPGCCVIPKGAEKIELCNKCGQVAGGADAQDTKLGRAAGRAALDGGTVRIDRDLAGDDGQAVAI